MDTGVRLPARDADRQAREVSESGWFRALARFGLVCKGVLFAIIGVLALDVAQGQKAKAASQKGALQEVAAQPGGKYLLIAIAIGLGAYALWRFAQAAWSGEKAFKRVGYLASGIVYAGVFGLDVSMLVGSSSSGGSGNVDRVTTWVMREPGGVWAVGAAGVVLVLVGLWQGKRALSRDFLDDMTGMGATVRRWVARIGTAGLLARMVVFALLGLFLVQAAREFDPKKAVGLDGALEKLVRESYGPILLGIVAVGLVCYGAYCFAEARYRRV